MRFCDSLFTRMCAILTTRTALPWLDAARAMQRCVRLDWQECWRPVSDSSDEHLENGATRLAAKLQAMAAAPTGMMATDVLWF